MEVFFSRFARTKWFYSVACNDVFFNSCGEKNAVLRVAVLGYWHLAYWTTVAKRKARMSTQSLLIIIVVVVVYKINCMQKRINGCSC